MQQQLFIIRAPSSVA